MKSRLPIRAYQPTLIGMETGDTLTHAKFNGRSACFTDNMSLPVHRWYRYSAGFSADWVRWLIRERRSQFSDFTVLDPFCGVGTTLLACDAENVKSLGFESHPFVNRMAKAKLRGIHVN